MTVGEDETPSAGNGTETGGGKKIRSGTEVEEEKAERILTGKKLSFWHLCSERDRRQLVMNFSAEVRRILSEYVRQHYLGNLSSMNDRMVLFVVLECAPAVFAFRRRTAGASGDRGNEVQILMRNHLVSSFSMRNPVI